MLIAPCSNAARSPDSDRRQMRNDQETTL